ncbi:4-hydroxy-tetrahydrodipicolinate synthase [Desulfovibrionales bacterium]
MQFIGVLTALVTPFRNMSVDEEAYRNHIEWQIEQGIHGMVPCGTTGESATLSHDEHKQVINICVDQVKGRVPVLAGAGSNNTTESIELAKHAKRAGADGLLLITPYYNKPTQEGLIAHYRAISAAVKMPCVLYNVPSRTSLNLLPTTVARIAWKIPEVVGIKEATGDLKQVSEIVESCPPGFQVISGDDFTILPILAVGGCGVISVVSNIVPALVISLYNAFTVSDLVRARQVHYELSPLSRAMFIETNPASVKTALALMGRMQPDLRLPLVALTQANTENLKQILDSIGLLT